MLPLAKLFLVASVAVAVAEVPTGWDFEHDPPGRTPGHFTAEVGTWVVQDDPVAKNRVLAQTAKNDDETFNVLLHDDARLGDLNMSVRVKAVEGFFDRGGGLVWRAKDARNYYVVRYNPLEANFRVYKVVAGVRTLFASATVKADKDWHTIRVTMIGPTMTCYLDGEPHLHVEDRTFAGPGKIGLWTKADARSLFDDLKAEAVVLP